MTSKPWARRRGAAQKGGDKGARTTQGAGWCRAARRARAEEQMRAELLDRPEPAPSPRPQLPMQAICLGSERIH